MRRGKPRNLKSGATKKLAPAQRIGGRAPGQLSSTTSSHRGTNRVNDLNENYTTCPPSVQRRRLPNRRSSWTFGFSSNNLSYTATISYFANGVGLAEVFLGNSKSGSHSDAAAKDSAIVCSIALQFGVPLETIRKALLRDSQNRPSSPLGVLLDMIAEQEAQL